jgi:hypothetical protein
MVGVSTENQSDVSEWTARRSTTLSEETGPCAEKLSFAMERDGIGIVERMVGQLYDLCMHRIAQKNFSKGVGGGRMHPRRGKSCMFRHQPRDAVRGAAKKDILLIRQATALYMNCETCSAGRIRGCRREMDGGITLKREIEQEKHANILSRG